MDNCRRCCAVSQEAIEDSVELIDRWNVDLQDEAVIAGDPVTFDDLRDPVGEVGCLGKLAGIGDGRGCM